MLIQVDGVRVPHGFSFGAQNVGRGDYVDLGLIKSVEILRGPSSALYGSDGLAGAVSFITADPSDFLESGKAIGGLVRASLGDSDARHADGDFVRPRAVLGALEGGLGGREFGRIFRDLGLQGPAIQLHQRLPRRDMGAVGDQNLSHQRADGGAQRIGFRIRRQEPYLTGPR